MQRDSAGTFREDFSQEEASQELLDSSQICAQWKQQNINELPGEVTVIRSVSRQPAEGETFSPASFPGAPDPADQIIASVTAAMPGIMDGACASVRGSSRDEHESDNELQTTV
ncbi:hypothetical protein Q5P01_009526 [Channa striata]|uniref:Uncharacterized protein n=1 Tax=Channa striata TaxID=64152 RepID=A0AA88MX36_CHASR|nr:hypothetical protein Q5P01_009526 [Channa striata]